MLIVQEGHAVILERGGKISRITGNGVYDLKSFEHVVEVVPLWQKNEQFIVEHIVTRDQVFIDRLELFIRYEVDPTDGVRHSGKYSFNEQTIYERFWTPGATSAPPPGGNPEIIQKLADSPSSSASKFPNGPEPAAKREPELSAGNSRRAILESIVSRVVRDVIARYDLRDVMILTQTSRTQFSNVLIERMNQIARFYLGTIILMVDVGEVTIQANARDQLWALWLKQIDERIAQIAAEITRLQGEGQASALWEVEQVKQKAREILMRETKVALTKGKNPLVERKVIALRFMELIEQLTKSLVREDIDPARYLETLEKFAQAQGDKTIMLGTENVSMLPESSKNEKRP